MKSQGIRGFGVAFIIVGALAGIVAAFLNGEIVMRAIAAALCLLIGVVVGFIFFYVANNKEKAERIRAAMEAADAAAAAVETATVLDPIEETIDPLILVDSPAEFEEIPEFLPDTDVELLVEPIEDTPAAPKYHPAYQYVRDKIVEKTPVTNEQMDKAEKIGKVAIPVAAATAVVLMAAKLVSYRKTEVRRRTFFDWLG